MTSARPRIFFFLSRISLLPPLFLSLAASAAEPGAAGAAGASPSRLAWALKPGILESLSPAARRSVLVANGLAPAPAGGVPAAPPVRDAAAARALAVPVPRQNVRVNDPTLDVDHHAARTSSIAARGPLVVVAFEDATDTSAGYGLSHDGGATFAHMRIPQGPDVVVWGSPSVAIGPNGEIYDAFLQSVPGDPAAVALAKSTDGGVTFPGLSNPSGLVEDGFAVMDSPVVAVDGGAASPRKGSVYVAWTYYDPYSTFWAVLVSSSTDGAAFSTPKTFPPTISQGIFVGRPALAVAPNGDLYLAYENGYASPDGIAIARSTDGGQTFTLRAVATFPKAAALSAGSGGAAPNPGPALAVDGNGVVHVAWGAVSSGATSDRSDVFYARSTDNAATFSAARKLNDDGTSTAQAFPALAALPDGTVAVRWADRRNDPARDTLNDVYMAISRDDGATWGKNFRITDRNAPWAPAPHNLATSGHTAYDGLAADGGNFYVSFTDERSGDADVYAAVVPETFDASAPDFDFSAVSTYAAIARGGTATFDLAATGVNGFSGALALAPDVAAPAGLSLSLSSASAAAGQTVRLTVTASASAPPGDYVLGVAATAGGLVRGTRVRLTVMGASSGVPPPVPVTKGRGFATGSVKADPAGVLHAVTDDDSGQVAGSEVFYRRSTDGGATFSAPVRLHAAGSYAHESAFAIDATGRIFVVWSGRVIADPTPRIYFVRSTDGGATFSAPLAVNGNTGYAVLPNVAADAGGNIVVGWFDLSGDAPVVGWSRSTNAGTSFTAAVPVYDAPVVFTRPGVAIDSKNNAYLAWTQQGSNTSAVRLAISKAGAAFGSPATVTDSALLSFAPDLAVGPDDSLGLAYYSRTIVDGVAQNRRITFQRSTNSGAAFGSAAFLSSAADQAYVPAVVFETSGAIDVAWEEFDANDVQSDVWLARSTDGGATFSPPVDLSSNGGFSGSAADPADGIGGPGRAAVSVGANGTLVVSWTDDTGSAADLFVSTPRAALVSNRPPVPAITSPAPNASFGVATPVTFTGSATDPDGDPVTLTWDFGDGRTATGAAPPPLPFAVTGAHRVTLTARDSNGATGTAAITINVVTSPGNGGDAQVVIPVVLESAGVGGSRYTSEVTLVSRRSQPTDAFLFYRASVGSGEGVARVTLAPGEMRVLPGILAWLRGQGVPIPDDGSAQVGTLAVTFAGAGADAGLVWAGARTFTPDPLGGAGTFGLFMPADPLDPPRDESSMTLVGLQQNASQRSNLAVVNEGGQSIVLRVTLQGPNGEDLGAQPDLSLAPLAWFQYNQPLAGKAASGRAVVTRVSGTSTFTAYAVLNDAVTSDGSFLPPLFGDDGSGADRLVPVVLDVAGLGARFRTELTLANLTASPLPLTLVYTAAAGFGSGSGGVPVTLAAGEQRIVPDAIAFLRATLPIENDGRNVAGSLLVKAVPGAPASALAVGARTFVPLSPAGSYGLFYPGLTAAQCATDTAWVYGLQENASQRSNLALVNRGDAGDVIVLRTTYFDSNGGALASVPHDQPLAPGQWFQVNRPFAGTGVSAGYVRIEKISGASRFAAYGVLNDNVTSDGSYVSMTF